MHGIKNIKNVKCDPETFAETNPRILGNRSQCLGRDALQSGCDLCLEFFNLPTGTTGRYLFLNFSVNTASLFHVAVG